MHEFLRTIFYTFLDAFPSALLGLAVGGVILVLLHRKRHREGTRVSKGQAAAILLLLCYLGGLAAITLVDRTDHGMRMGVQLRPFLAFWEAWNTFTLKTWLNPLLNTAMFLPLGALLPLAAKPFRRWYWALAAGCGASVVIEVLQYILSRGQADVDDLLCNTLGTMLGYCLCMLVVSLAGKRWKAAGAYAAFPVLFAAALAGVFLVYHFQPYGNLADAPIYAAHTKDVEWVQECALSDEPGPSGVYWTEPFTLESCDAFATDFLTRAGVAFDFTQDDVIYYDESAYYSDHRTYALLVDYKDRSYSYTDYRVDSDLRYSDKSGTVTEAELCAKLEALGIDIPDGAQFEVEDRGEWGTHFFRAEAVMENGMLTNGTLACHVAEDGSLYEVDNDLCVSALYGHAAVISSQEAYDRLRAGRFSWRDVPMFDSLHPSQVRVTDCTLEYMTDSKGFRQPVYSFILSDDWDEELRGGDGWTTFVPALAGS